MSRAPCPSAPAPPMTEAVRPPQLREQLLDEIRRDGSTRQSIAAIYREGIIYCQRSGNYAAFDWPIVNGAILKRYTPSGLNFIKTLAWKHT